ncbi:MAG: carboxypeptidase-like regulatory domain-containing protein [Taibaiella sp.]|nr:carboxypeptidase-like regulatory domain-containing protein [Taibaiella sp.]
MNRLRHICWLVLLLLSTGAFAQHGAADVVQINGVIITADSLRAVPYATVLVKNQNRGVEASNLGVFTLVCYKGDTLQFSEVGFRPKEFVISKNIQGEYFSMIQLMTQDTFYLQETIIRALPSREEFDYAFRHWHVASDQYDIARRNTNRYTLRAIAYTLPHDGRESQAMYQSQQARDAVYYGQQKPMNILNPLAWAEFFQAWKRGDFRNHSY